MIPPASLRMHQAAATSQDQHPHSQKASCCPAATLHIAIAADPVQRSELTNRPPVEAVLAKVVKTFKLSSKFGPSRSLPHSIPMHAGPNPRRGVEVSGSCSFSPLSRWVKAPLPLTALQSSLRNGFQTTPIVGRFEMTSPTEMHTAGNPWTKLEVPSIGSTMNVGSSVRGIPAL